MFNHRIALLVPVLLIILRGVAYSGQADKRLDVYWVDVEGGAATLMVMPTGESVLVDTGNPGLRDAQRIFEVAARVAGLRQIDHLLITHYHGDHFGGAATLAELLPIKNVYDNGQFEGGRERPEQGVPGVQSGEAAGNQSGRVHQAAQRRTMRRAPPLSLKCLAARQQFVPASGSEQANPLCAECKSKERDISDNANSVVLLLTFGPFKFFDAGDLTWNMEEKLICPVNLVGEVDVYQVTHHGLDTSNNPVLVREPGAARGGDEQRRDEGLSAGYVPDAQELPLHSGHLSGAQEHAPDGSVNNAPDEYIANLEAMCEGHYIKLSVDPAGRSYTVSIPAKGHERTYEVKSNK